MVSTALLPRPSQTPGLSPPGSENKRQHPPDGAPKPASVRGDLTPVRGEELAVAPAPGAALWTSQGQSNSGTPAEPGPLPGGGLKPQSCPRRSPLRSSGPAGTYFLNDFLARVDLSVLYDGVGVSEKHPSVNGISGLKTRKNGSEPHGCEEGTQNWLGGGMGGGAAQGASNLVKQQLPAVAGVGLGLGLGGSAPRSPSQAAPATPSLPKDDSESVQGHGGV